MRLCLVATGSRSQGNVWFVKKTPKATRCELFPGNQLHWELWKQINISIGVEKGSQWVHCRASVQNEVAPSLVSLLPSATNWIVSVCNLGHGKVPSSHIVVQKLRSNACKELNRRSPFGIKPWKSFVVSLSMLHLSIMPYLNHIVGAFCPLEKQVHHPGNPSNCFGKFQALYKCTKSLSHETTR